MVPFPSAGSTMIRSLIARRVRSKRQRSPNYDTAAANVRSLYAALFSWRSGDVPDNVYPKLFSEPAGFAGRGCESVLLQHTLTHWYTHLREMWMLKRLQGSKAVPSIGGEGTAPVRTGNERASAVLQAHQQAVDREPHTSPLRWRRRPISLSQPGTWSMMG